MDKDNVLADLLRGVAGREARFDATPNAHWRKPEEIIGDPDLWFDPDAPGKKIFLGQVNGELVGVADDRHMIVVAGSRAGKGVSAIIPNLLAWSECRSARDAVATSGSFQPPRPCGEGTCTNFMPAI